VLAVIGGGAAATAFLLALAKRVSAVAELEAPAVVVFEPAPPCGPGLAYRPDIDSALLNRPHSAMSVDSADPGHFRRWLARAGGGLGSQREKFGAFVPRHYFGSYLRDAFATACAELRSLGGEVEVVADAVSHTQRTGNRWMLRSATGRVVYAEDVVLCPGALPARDLYGLDGVPNYVQQPYPLGRSLAGIDRDSRVLVLGMGLTALDVALLLGNRGVRTLTLTSRHGLVPDVRGDLSGGECAPRLYTELEGLLRAQTGVRAEQVLALLEAELARSATTMAEAIAPFVESTDPVDFLRRRLAQPGPAAAIQRCSIALTPLYSRLWKALTQADRSLFNLRYRRTFACLRNPMPPGSARRLVNLADSGRLSFQPGVLAVRPDGDGFEADFRNHRTGQFDTVINATGRCIDVSAAPRGSLLGHLLSSGAARSHPLGGLEVDPDTNELIDDQGSIQVGLHVIGDMSSGVHFHSSSMEYVATQATLVSRHVAERFDRP
jgi:uncharacterized NAD(P)/FAD-binding protein YdhS